MIKKITCGIRDVDEKVYRRFRGRCEELKILTGDAVSEALKLWLKKHAAKKIKKSKEAIKDA